MGKWVLYTQPNYAHPKPTQTPPFATPIFIRELSVIWQHLQFKISNQGFIFTHCVF